MACGTPVISSNNSSIPEVVGDAGILIDPYQVYDIGNALVHVLDDKSMQKKMIKKGKKQAELFSWENAARETLNIYKETYNSNI
jgi:glycosyltransferase involved in cell wall biosynthesis